MGLSDGTLSLTLDTPSKVGIQFGGGGCLLVNADTEQNTPGPGTPNQK